MASHHKSIIVFELEKRLPWHKMCKNVIFDSQRLALSGGCLTYMKVGRDEDDDGSSDITDAKPAKALLFSRSTIMK